MKNHEIVDVYELKTVVDGWGWGCLRLLSIDVYPTFTELTNAIQKLGYEIVSINFIEHGDGIETGEYYKMLVRR